MLNSLGSAYRTLGDNEQALEHLQACVAIAGDAGAKRELAEAHLAIGDIAAGAGDVDGARASFLAATHVASDISLAHVQTLARCHLACLAAPDVAAALAALAEHDERLSTATRAEALYLLWRATGDRAYLVDAKGCIDEWLSSTDPDIRDDCARNLRVPRDILAAWQELDVGDEPGDPDSDGGPAAAAEDDERDSELTTRAE